MKNVFKVSEKNKKGYITHNGKQYKDGDPVPKETHVSTLRFLYQRGMIDSSGKGSKAVTSKDPLETDWGTQDETEAEQDASESEG